MDQLQAKVNVSAQISYFSVSNQIPNFSFQALELAVENEKGYKRRWVNSEERAVPESEKERIRVEERAKLDEERQRMRTELDEERERIRTEERAKLDEEREQIAAEARAAVDKDIWDDAEAWCVARLNEHKAVVKREADAYVRRTMDRYKNQCHNCGGFDHWKNECPMKGFGKRCLSCGIYGHLVDECTNPVRCYKCGHDGHTAATCGR